MMINTFDIYEELTTTVDEKTAKALTRILSRVYEDVRNTPSKEDFKRLEEVVYQLSQAQLKTEQRLDTLTKKVEELTEAQLKTEKTLEKAIGRINIIEERLEGISNSVGYSLENSAYKSLPQLLEPLGIKVTDKMIRKYINGYQVNIFSKAEKEDKEVYIVGECKVRPSTKEIDRFLKIVDNIKEHTGNYEIVTIFVAHDYPPNIERYIKAKGIIYFWSYEL